MTADIGQTALMDYTHGKGGEETKQVSAVSYYAFTMCGTLQYRKLQVQFKKCILLFYSLLSGGWVFSPLFFFSVLIFLFIALFSSLSHLFFLFYKILIILFYFLVRSFISSFLILSIFMTLFLKFYFHLSIPHGLFTTVTIHLLYISIWFVFVSPLKLWIYFPWLGSYSHSFYCCQWNVSIQIVHDCIIFADFIAIARVAKL